MILTQLTEPQIGSILNQFKEYLQLRTFPTDMFRSFLYGFLKFFYKIAKMCFDFFESFGGVVKFFQFNGLKNISDKLLISVGAMIVLSILISVIKSLINNKINKEMVRNAILSMIIIFSMPLLMAKGLELSTAFVQSINQTKNEQNLVDSAYRDCFIDVKNNIVKKNFKDVDLTKTNNLKVEKINDIQINEVMLNKEKEPIHQVLGYGIMDETNQIRELDKNGGIFGSLDLLTVGYYRWKIDYLYGTLMLLALAYFYLRNCLTLVKLGYDLAYNKIIGSFIIATDVETGEKRKIVLKEIAISYLTICSLYIAVLIFTELLKYIRVFNLQPFQRVLIAIGGIIAMNKGNNLIEKAFGVAPAQNRGSFLSSLSQIAITLSSLKNLKNNENKQSTSNNIDDLSSQNINSEVDSENKNFNSNTNTSDSDINENRENKSSSEFKKNESNTDLNKFRNANTDSTNNEKSSENNVSNNVNENIDNNNSNGFTEKTNQDLNNIQHEDDNKFSENKSDSLQQNEQTNSENPNEFIEKKEDIDDNQKNNEDNNLYSGNSENISNNKTEGFVERHREEIERNRRILNKKRLNDKYGVK